MSSDVCSDEVALQLHPQYEASEEATEEVCASGGGGGAGGGGARGAVELGRKLLAAARDGDCAAVLQLMAKGAPFTTDWLGTSPLHLAAANNQREMCLVLLRAGVSREARTKVERTPLHLAAYSGHLAAVDALLANGAPADCRDLLGMTPLHWAAERGHGGVAAALLRAGADPALQDRFYRTPADCARDQHMRGLLAEAQEEKARESETPAQPEYVTVEEEPSPQPSAAKKQKLQPRVINDADAKGGNVGAAALLRRHGITLLPADSDTTVLNAINSGRTVLLSDAGKLMLKETSADSPRIPTVSTPVSVTHVAHVTSVTPAVTHVSAVTTQPRQSTAKRKDLGNITIKKIVSSNDMQVKYVALPSSLPSMRLAPAPAPAPLPAPARATHRNKYNVVKLISNGNVLQLQQQPPAPGLSPAPGLPPAAARVPEQFVRSADPEYLRRHLLHAHANIAALQHQLQLLKQRLAHYEPTDEP